MIDWVLRADQAHAQPLFPAVIVLGPFMATEHQESFIERTEHLRDVHIIRFTPTIENLMDEAVAIVGMGGYNTFCEILSFDKPTLLVPRVQPRREQAIRAAKAESAGLLSVLSIERYPDVDSMVDALPRLPRQAPPSVAGVDGLLDGLGVINNRVAEFISAPQTKPARAAAGE